MKKAIIIAIASIVFLILSNVYYYIDMYRGQIDTQKDILLKQALIVGDQLTKYVKKNNTSVSILFTDKELRQLFSDKGNSVEVQKRLELLYLSYKEHLNTLVVRNVDGDVYQLKSGVGNTFISSFSKGDPLDIATSQMFVSSDGNKITYLQPLYKEHNLIGHIEFDIPLKAFFNSAFYNFNLEDFHFQWVLKPSGSVVYNTLGAKEFFPDNEFLEERVDTYRWFYEVHDININHKDVQVLTVFNRLDFNGNDYFMAFSMPMAIITSTIVKNSIVLVSISLLVIILIIVVFSIYHKRQLADEKALKKSEQALKKIVYYLPVGVLVYDNHGCVRHVNKAALKLFSFEDEDQLIGRKATDATLFENKLLFEKTTYSTHANKYVVTNKDNEESVILHEKLPFVLLREEYSLHVFMEVSLLEKERKSEELANKAKSTFIANISHELRTPLNSMIGLTDILLSSEMNPDDKNLLGVVKRSADTLLLLINDILDFSKIEAGRFEIASVPFNIVEEIDQCIESFLPKAREGHIDLTWTSSMPMPEDYLGDPMRFRQVLNNLFANAIKFTERGKVNLSVSEVRGLNGSPHMQFTIKDTGIGIQKDKLKTIFQSFSQADESITRKYGGTGLGVTICKQLVNLMGGEIWVESPSGLSNDPKYPGTSFAFTLPLRTNAYLKSYDHDHITSFSMIKAIVITDEIMQVSKLLRNLNALGIDCKIMSPSNETIDIIRTNKSHRLLVIDHRPDFNGLEFLQEIYNHKLHKKMPIIMQSSDFETINTSVAKQLGADVYFRKPINYSSLKKFLLKTFPNVITKGLGVQLDQSLSVLVAEDNILNQRLAKNLFQKIGHQIDLASNGKEAVEKVKNKKYDIVFMDVMMPGMNGVIAMQEIKREMTDCPVIAMTASIDMADKEVVMEAGMDDFILKPTKLEDLSRMLDKWCGSR